MSMRRRSFLIAGVGAGAAIAGGLLLPPGQAWLRQWSGTTALPAHLRLGREAYAVLDGLQGTDALAQAFLDQYDHDDTTLENWLLDHLGVDPNDPIAGAEFGQRLRTAIIDDFANDRLCDANDWLLSETECRAAALRYRVFGPTPAGRSSGFRDGVVAEVTNWGPRSTEQGTPVNVQPDGHSGLWFRAIDAPLWLKVEIDGETVPITVTEDVFTSGLYGTLQERILAEPGEYPIVLIDEMSRIRQPLGYFVVHPRVEPALLADGQPARSLCAIEDWGPRETTVGIPVNLQPNDASGLWFRTVCAPTNAIVLFDGVRLATTIDLGRGVVTARLPNSHLGAARTATIALHDPDAGQTLEIGKFIILDRGH